jgi:hypothetical protein
MVIDNASTRKTPAIQRWLLAHPRFHVHFTPISASWLNLVERWFAELTAKWLRRGTHRSVAELERDPRLGPAMERRPAAVCVAQDRRRDPSTPSPHTVPDARSGVALGSTSGGPFVRAGAGRRAGDGDAAKSRCRANGFRPPGLVGRARVASRHPPVLVGQRRPSI